MGYNQTKTENGGILMKTILIVDDDQYINDMLKEALTKEGYGILRAFSGTEALMVLEKHTPDLVLLDLMLPGISGEELLSEIKRLPVIVVSAKADMENKVNLLLNGAADYITKPFDLNELLARIKIQLRNSERTLQAEVYTYGELTLEANLHRVSVNGNEIKLTRTELAILKLLISQPEKVITKASILDSISLDTPDCVEASLKVHISNIRKKIREYSQREYIESVWGIGFKLGCSR